MSAHRTFERITAVAALAAGLTMGAASAASAATSAAEPVSGPYSSEGACNNDKGNVSHRTHIPANKLICLPDGSGSFFMLDNR